MAVSSEKTSPNAVEREIVLTRVLDAPRDLVYKAWTEPERLLRWWGPQGWTNPRCEVDLRVGGAWRIVMRSPDGGEYPCGGEYREIVPPEKIVFTNNALDEEGQPLLEGLTTITLVEQNGKTTLTLRTYAKGMVSYAAQMLAGMEMGWSQSLDKMERMLAHSTPTADREIVTTRVFDAPPELVYEAWTDPKHLAQWWGPNGFKSTIQEMDVRPGGSWRLVMHGPDGIDYQNESIFVEVVKPVLLSYTHLSTPKFHATVTFEAQERQTKLTLRMVFHTVEERDRTVKEFGAVEGAKQTLGRLAEFLKAV